MLIVLPFATYVLFVWSLHYEGSTNNLSTALIKGHIVFFAIIAIATELLSPFHLLRLPALSILWSTLLLVGLVTAITLRLSRRPRLGAKLPSIMDLSSQELLMAAAMALILAITLTVVFLYPPNNVDSMTYHMARVAHWVHNGSVQFYPTSISRQNYEMPLAEFAILHLQLLSRTDIFANMVQWYCFFISIILGGAITAALGGNKKAQVVSALVVATLPMAILQSTSTQNDLVVSSFLLAFAFFMLRLQQDFSTENALFVGLSLGLAFLTKGTAYLYGAGIGISLAIPIIIKARPQFVFSGRRMVALLLILFLALTMNAGFYYRNIRLYNYPLAPEGKEYLNREYSAATLSSNLLRNAAIHWGTPSHQLNRFGYRIVKFLLGKQLNDPATTWPHTSFVIGFSLHEDATGNPVQFLLALIASFIVLIAAWRRKTQTAWYIVGVLLATLLYCWFLKWQPWASRLHTPLFLLIAPITGLWLASIRVKVKIVYYVAIACLLVYALPYVFMNASRSVVSRAWHRKPRMALYFQNDRRCYDDYSRAIQIVKRAQAKEVGLHLGGNDVEYPLWVLAGAHAKANASMYFRHVGVINPTRRLQKERALPLYVLSTESTGNWVYKKRYRPVFSSQCINVLKRDF